jgi:hypothetical protein
MLTWSLVSSVWTCTMSLGSCLYRWNHRWQARCVSNLVSKSRSRRERSDAPSGVSYRLRNTSLDITISLQHAYCQMPTRSARFASSIVAKMIMSKMIHQRRRQRWQAAQTRPGSTDARNAHTMTTSPAASRHNRLVGWNRRLPAAV